ncbi:hypothetical protein SKAU_G00203830 [Synaphobranchus kaupii]|uniref:Uncharacterized protein n=1 Tax=Synaphobranchus kaupii TaxID=118154 RepID=A0A9Q1FG10_SYNKA|nr:hypothetical protein SKAU_G00203830 [Synaphobranchus kaupii]
MGVFDSRAIARAPGRRVAEPGHGIAMATNALKAQERVGLIPPPGAEPASGSGGLAVEHGSRRGKRAPRDGGEPL